VDLFAGTHSVGFSMRRRNRVIGVDIQQYSGVIGSAVLRDQMQFAVPELLARLRRLVDTHVAAASEIYRRSVDRERELVRALVDGRADGAHADEFAAFQVSLPDPSRWSAEGAPLDPLDARLNELIRERRDDPRRFPYILLSSYYANAYFGLRQALVLDALRYAIDQLLPVGEGRDICMAALLSAASNCTSTPGHFAMWRVIRTDAAAIDIARFRARDPWVYFAAKLEELVFRSAVNSRDHQVLTKEAAAFVDDYDGAVGLVYIDPPYSTVHYSRFYHVLEELVEYDYPPVYFAGRFPANRYSSAWSVRTQAVQAFGELLSTLARRNWPAVISYGSNGVVSEATLVRLCQGAFGNAGVQLDHLVTRHASMGRSDRGSRPTRELLITCRPSRRRPQTARRPGSRS
jgi:adenine-specific DNA-methyltransferase